VSATKSGETTQDLAVGYGFTIINCFKALHSCDLSKIFETRVSSSSSLFYLLR